MTDEEALKLRVELACDDAKAEIEDLEQKAGGIELGIDTSEAEKNLDNVSDKLDEVAEKGEDTGKKMGKGIAAGLGVAVHELGDLLKMAGKLGEA